MSDSVIRVENLSKKYTIGHQKQERYTALRDVLSDKVKGLGNFFNRHAKNQDEAFEDFWALKDVSFEIKQGDRVGIIGRNGAGKSTLLKILSRITEPTSGKISIKGRVASLLEVGTGFHPELTGRENIYLNGAILGMDRFEIKKKFDEIVAFAEVEKFLDTPVKRYSSGMYVRLAFAVAAHLEPEILIVDEVLAVGDATFQKKCLGKMEQISDTKGRTIIFVSHNISAIKRLCNQGLFLLQGRLVTQCAIESVINAYQNSFTEEERDHDVSVTIKTDFHKSLNSELISIKDIKVFGETSKALDVIKTGDTLNIEINYFSHQKIISPAFIVTCKSVNGTELFQLCTSPISGYPLEDIEVGQGRIGLKLHSIPLLGGVYYFDISLARTGISRYFTLEQVVKLTIDPTDVYDSGFDLDQKFGLIAISHSWYL